MLLVKWNIAVFVVVLSFSSYGAMPDAKGLDGSMAAEPITEDKALESPESGVVEDGGLPQNDIPVNENPFLIRSRNYVGDGYVAIVSKVDHFFAGKELSNDINRSHLRLITKGTWFKTKDSKYDIKIKAKFDLPGAKQRYNLFFDSNVDESNSIVDRNRPVSTGDRVREGSSIAGLEYRTKDGAYEWNQSVSLGAKLNTGVNLLVRYRLKKRWALSPVWDSYYRHDLWYLDGVGWGSTGHSELTRTINEKLWFQVISEVEYRDEVIDLEYVHILQFDQKLNDRYGLNYRIGFIGEGPRGNVTRDRFINTTLRYGLYEDWVLLYITPEVYYEEVKNYKSETSLTIKFEFFLTD